MGLFEEQVLDVLGSPFGVSDMEVFTGGSLELCKESDMSNSSVQSSDLGAKPTSADIEEPIPWVGEWLRQSEGSVQLEQGPDSTASSSHSDRQPPAARDSRAMLRPIPRQKQFKKWKNATASKYCHSCGVVPRGDKVVCRNLETSTCRKVFCRTCIEKIYGSWGDEHVNQVWECTHCAGACPVKATCRYYAKRNQRRGLKRART